MLVREHGIVYDKCMACEGTGDGRYNQLVGARRCRPRYSHFPCPKCRGTGGKEVPLVSECARPWLE